MLRTDSAPPPDCPHLLAGRDALARGAWEDARAEFAASLASQPTPQAWEGLASAAAAVSDADRAIEAGERAFALWRERGERRRAAAAALALHFDVRSLRGDLPRGDGWLAIAAEQLDGLGDVPERGWWLLRETEARLVPALAFDEVVERMAEVRAIAAAHGDRSLAMEALALEGSARVRRGEVAEGLRCLDQAATAAASDADVDPFSGGAIMCQVLSNYERVRDYERGAQWCTTFQELTARARVRPLGSLCRNYYAGVLMARGLWSEAEAALALGTQPVPWVAQRSLVRLGELRLRQGRHDEAEALFHRAIQHPEAKLGLATLALERGDARAAADLVERHLRQLGDARPLDRIRAAFLAVRIHVALGELETAAEVLAGHEAFARTVGTAGLTAGAAYAAGLLARARGDRDGARLAVEDAVDGYARAGMPFERAAARLALAGELDVTGRKTTARDEASRAREEFEELGAATGVREACALEQRLDAECCGADAPPAPLLSAREREVLGLVAQGLSNKEVAARLFLSEHTIKRHVANVLTRLELPSRAAAVAWALKHELL